MTRPGTTEAPHGGALPPAATAIGERAEEAMRERELALAVIRQAISDATTKRVVGAARRGGSAASVTAAERQEARAFLTDRTGPWAIARRLWCDAAGVTPAWLERHVARSLV